MTSAQAAGARAEARTRGGAESAPAEAALERSLPLGWIAVLPLVAAYEIALVLGPDSARNTAEYLLSLPFEAVLPRPELGRWAVEIAVTAWAGWTLFHGELGLVRRTARIALEGFAAAILLGPLLVALLHVLHLAAPAIGRPAAVATPASAALLVGGAAFEEVLFRVVVLAALVVVARHTFEWFLGLARTARVLAEGTALLGSALVFAAAHLSPVVGLVSPGGEPYDGARFAWRATAGLVLAVLFRWRGMGVAAWCHAFFNLALALGAGPEVFL